MSDSQQIIVTEKYIIKLFDLNNENNYEKYNKTYADLKTEPNLIGVKIFEDDIEINSCIIGSERGSTTIHDTSNY